MRFKFCLPDSLNCSTQTVMRFSFLSILFLSVSCFSQDASVFKPDSIKMEVQAIRTNAMLHIDGHLDEADWALAIPFTRFKQIEPSQGLPASQRTELKVLYNRQYLYVGVIAFDSLGKKAIRATDFKRDFNIRSHDLVSISLDPFNDHRNAMSFATNAYGVQRDLLVFDDILTDLDWDGLWKVRTTRTDSGWISEMAIPWETMRYPKSKDSLQNWEFNMIRTRRLTNEIDAFSPYPRSFSINRMAYAGILKGLAPPPPKTNIRFQPYLLGAYDSYKNYPASTKPEQNAFRAGGDIKWAMSPNKILDLTFNTDFAQADADRQVNNTSRFSVFFPERRQFFLENASLFGPGVAPADDQSGGSMRIQPFFSRKIGLDDAGNPIPLDAGGRYVFRSLKRNFGLMAMRQRAQGSLPGTNYFVGRYSENLGSQNRIGTLVTMKNNADGTNLVTAIDGFFRLGDSHSLNTMLIRSSNSKGGKDGYSGYAQYYFSNNQWKIWWTQTFVSKNFDPGMGFVSRSNVIGTTPGIYWYYRGNKLPFRKWLRAFEPSILTEFYHEASTGKLLESQVNMNPVWLNFKDGGFFGYLVNPTFQRLTETFSPLGIPISVGTYHYVRHTFYYNTDPSKAISLSSSLDLGSYFNGKLNTISGTLRIAPDPHFAFSVQLSRNEFKKIGDSLQSLNANLWIFSGRLALNPRLQLIGFYQLNTLSDVANYNIRLSWEYRPLSYLYVVFNHRGFDNTQFKRQTDDHLIVKFSYLHQL